MACPRWIVFDLDGTLVHTGHLDEAFRAVAVEAAVADAAVDEALATVFAHQPFDRTLAGLLPDHPVEAIDEMVERFWRQVADRPGDKLPGADAALAWANEAAEGVFLSTGSHPLLVQATLDAYGWHDRFALACGSSPGFDKAAEHLPACAETAGVGLTEFGAAAMTIGDGITEMRHGVALHMPWRVGIAVEPARRTQLAEAGATLLIDSVAELPRACAGEIHLLH